MGRSLYCKGFIHNRVRQQFGLTRYAETSFHCLLISTTDLQHDFNTSKLQNLLVDHSYLFLWWPMPAKSCSYCAALALLTWWVHEVKMHQVIDAQFLQLQHHRTQVGPQNLRVCVFLHLCCVCLLCVQPEALAWPCTSSSTCTLLSAGFGDGSHQEGLDTDARVVHLVSN